MKESDIRRIVNGYSRETAGHPFTDYGNSMDIKVNDPCPIYECLVSTQYEDRSAEEKRRPYRGWSLSPQKYFSLHDIDPWGIKLKIPADFVDKKTFVEIEGSAHVDRCGSCGGAGSGTCHTCLGKGKNTCPSCHGDWQHLSCSKCKGTGKAICSDCGGKGEHVCSRCHGTGTITEMISEWKTHYDYSQKKEIGGYEQVRKTRSCPSCSGRGHWRCNSCGGTGTVSCTHCGGRGYVTCPDCSKGFIICKTCGGEGKLVCSVCEGEGRNETRIIVNRSLTQATARSYVCDSRVREFAESHGLDYTAVDFNVRDKVLEGELYPEDAKCSSRLSKLLARSEPDSGIILFQEAKVQHVESTLIEYEFNGSSYGGIICNGVFYPDGSPIDEWSSGLVEDAGKRIKRGSSAKSLKLLEQAREAGADSRVINELRAKALKKLGNLQKAGSSVAFWLVVLSISPVVYNFYSKLNPVASWAIVTNNPAWKFHGFVPVCQTLIFLAMALVIKILISSSPMRDNGKDHSSIWVYFAKGFSGYLAAFIAALAAFLLLNYLGLSILTTFILGVIIVIAALVIGIIELIVHWIV